MNLKEVLQQNPKAAEKLYEFMGSALKKLQALFAEEVPEGVESTLPEIYPEAVKSYTNTIIDMYPRNLFTFFDQQEIYIVIDYDYDRLDAPEWFYITWKGTSEYYDTREKAEMEAFKFGFILLEEKLNKQ